MGFQPSTAGIGVANLFGTFSPPICKICSTKIGTLPDQSANLQTISIKFPKYLKTTHLNERFRFQSVSISAPPGAFSLAFQQQAYHFHPTAPLQALKEPKQLPQDHTKNHLKKTNMVTWSPPKKTVMIFWRKKRKNSKMLEETLKHHKVASTDCNMFKPFNHFHLINKPSWAMRLHPKRLENLQPTSSASSSSSRFLPKTEDISMVEGFGGGA